MILRSEVEVEYTSKFTISSRALILLFAITLIVGGFIIFIPSVQTANGSYVFQRMWGTQGMEAGQFKAPTDVAVDHSGNVFVVENGNYRIQKFRLSSPCPTGTTQVVSGVCFVTKWGTQGTGPGQFDGLSGIAIDSFGNVFVADAANSRIQKFTNNGGFIRTWGTEGTGPGQFNDPFGLAIDTSGNVFVADTFNYRIQKFTNTGTFVTAWGTQGTGPEQFDFPFGLDVTNPGIVIFKEYVYVAEVKNNRIQVFTWKPDVQPTTNLNLKGSLENNNTAVTSK